MISKKASKRYKLHSINPNCGICGIAIDPIQVLDIANITIDHKLPLKLGGSNKLDNLQLAHKKCNSFKGHYKLGDHKIWASRKWYKHLQNLKTATPPKQEDSIE